MTIVLSIRHSSFVNRHLPLALGIMLFGQLLAAQPEAPADTLRPAADSVALAVPPDSAETRRADTAQAARPNAKKTRTVTTGKAMLLSALIPGGGQFYCHSYVKGGLYAAGELGIAGVTVYEDQVMRRAFRAHQSDTLSLRNRRNNLLWWTGAVWAFTIADAYVSASMYGFKEEQRFEAEVAPLGIGVCYRF
jgi:hypothetical protein